MKASRSTLTLQDLSGRLRWTAFRAEEGRRRARSETRGKAAEQSYCTGRHSSLYRPRLAQGQCLRERQQLVEGAPVSSMPLVLLGAVASKCMELESNATSPVT